MNRRIITLVLALLSASSAVAVTPPPAKEPQLVDCQAAKQLLTSCPPNSDRYCLTISSDSQQMASLSLPIEGHYDLEGYACDPKGAALSFVTISVIGLKVQTGKPVERGDLPELTDKQQESLPLTAGPDGHFEVSGLPGGSYVLDVTGGSLHTDHVTFSVATVPIPEL